MTQRFRTLLRREFRALPAILAMALVLPSPLRAQTAAASSPASGSPPVTTAPVTAAPGSSAPVTVAPGNVAAQKKVTVLGLGLMSCEAYAALQQAGAGDIVNQWLLGFLSGGGAFAGSNYLGGTGNPDAIKLVQHYCVANPKASLAVAGLEVAEELEGPLGQMRHK